MPATFYCFANNIGTYFVHLLLRPHNASHSLLSFIKVIVLLNYGKLWDATVGIENATQNKTILSISRNLLSKVTVTKNPLTIEKFYRILTKALSEAVRMEASIIHKHQLEGSSKSSKVGFRWQDKTLDSSSRSG